MMWYEATATYAEDETFDNANDNYNYLWPDAEQCLGEWGASPYPNWLVFRHAAEHYGGTNTANAGGGEDIIQDLFVSIGAGRGALGAYEDALPLKGTTLDDQFHQYAIATKFSKTCGSGYSSPYCYEEGADYVQHKGGVPASHATIATVVGSYSGTIRDNYAVNWVTLPTGAAPFSARLTNTATGGDLRGTLVCDTGSGFRMSAFPQVVTAGTSSQIATFNPVGCQTIVAVITNQAKTDDNPASCASHGYALQLVQEGGGPTPTSTPTVTKTPTATATATVTATPTTPAACSISINSGVAYTAERSVTLTFSAQGASEMQLSNDGGFAGATWQPYQSQTSWIMEDPGARIATLVVYARFRNAQSQLLCGGGNFSDNIVYDPLPPTVNLSIEQPAPLLTYNRGSVTVTVQASDQENGSGVADLQKSMNSNFVGATWQPFATSFVVDAGTENAIWYVRVRDHVGNVSSTASINVEGGTTTTLFLPVLRR
ncbi:MAG: hypothetical protein H0T73_18135 [Ardenticatenales bacterium]|nr:hypothetical protein [Ardenticatenales bacterium]